LNITKLCEQLLSIHEQLGKNTKPFFLVRSSGSTVEVGAVDKYSEFFANVPQSSVRQIFIINSIASRQPCYENISNLSHLFSFLLCAYN